MSMYVIIVICTRRAIYHHTKGVAPSRPLHMGQPTFGQER